METFPDEIDLLAFFEGEPTFQDKEYLHFAYKYTDQNEMSLLFSFSATGDWIQTIIDFKQKRIAHNLMEDVEYFKVHQGKALYYKRHLKLCQMVHVNL